MAGLGLLASISRACPYRPTCGSRAPTPAEATPDPQSSKTTIIVLNLIPVCFVLSAISIFLIHISLFAFAKSNGKIALDFQITGKFACVADV